jgi:hypothetical protein
MKRSPACELSRRPNAQNGINLEGAISRARIAAGAFGFLTLIQVFDGPEDFSSRQFSNNNMSPVIMKMSPM